MKLYADLPGRRTGAVDPGLVDREGAACSVQPHHIALTIGIRFQPVSECSRLVKERGGRVLISRARAPSLTVHWPVVAALAAEVEG